MNYTREEVENLPAGAVLNRMVSEYVFGHVRRNIEGKQNLLIDPADLPTWEHIYPQIAVGWVEGAADGIGDGVWSNDMARAWEVVVQMQALEDAGKLNPFWFNFWHSLGSSLRGLSGKSAATHICRAALIACLPAKPLTEIFAEAAELFKNADFSMLEED